MDGLLAASKLPELTTVFDIPGFQQDFWGMLKVVFYFVSPLLMIYAATEYAGVFIRVIRDAFNRIMGDGKEDDYDYDDSHD